MPGRAQSRLMGIPIPVEYATPSKYKGVKRGTGVSGTETLDEEWERFLKYFNDPEYNKIIIDSYTADLALNDMLNRWEDLKTLFDESSQRAKDDFKNNLVDAFKGGNKETLHIFNQIKANWGAEPTMLNPNTKRPVTRAELNNMLGTYDPKTGDLIKRPTITGASWFR